MMPVAQTCVSALASGWSATSCPIRLYLIGQSAVNATTLGRFPPVLACLVGGQPPHELPFPSFQLPHQRLKSACSHAPKVTPICHLGEHSRCLQGAHQDHGNASNRSTWTPLRAWACPQRGRRGTGPAHLDVQSSPVRSLTRPDCSITRIKSATTQRLSNATLAFALMPPTVIRSSRSLARFPSARKGADHLVPTLQ